jgi:hypothetical protein
MIVEYVISASPDTKIIQKVMQKEKTAFRHLFTAIMNQLLPNVIRNWQSTSFDDIIEKPQFLTLFLRLMTPHQVRGGTLNNGRKAQPK